MVLTRRVYEPPAPEEKCRVLVDRMWPRGFSKDNASWNEWMKEIAPSDQLRKWFNHDPEKWEDFRKAYKNELSQKQDELSKVKELESRFGTLTLVYAAKDEKHNNASVLKEVLMHGE
jgi:uncharacterized protein YeaO (DUF488 family)